MASNAVLIEEQDGSVTITDGVEKLGTIKQVKKGHNKGQFEYQSFFAIDSAKHGFAESQNEALAHLGFKVVSKKTDSRCYLTKED